MADASPATKTPLWVKIVLGVSLALNLLIIGAIGGVVVRGGPAERQGIAMNTGVPYLIALPREDRIRVIRGARQADAVPNRRERKASYREMLEILRNDPFDETRATALLERHGQTALSTQKALQAAWLERIGDMSASERAIYAERLEEVLRRGGKRQGKKDR
ncbi:MAG: periplasmic heavy metal sensor [Rhodobacteraceae bacterium]|nr:periplasmic heavy metal sensor [Paracoccaceae bacterium]